MAKKTMIRHIPHIDYYPFTNEDKQYFFDWPITSAVGKITNKLLTSSNKMLEIIDPALRKQFSTVIAENVRIYVYG